jgi:adenosylhomocysteine nucleosidase
MSRRIGIVAAMEVEIAPLVRGWNRQTVEQNGRQILVFESEKAAAGTSGIGVEAGKSVAKYILEQYECNCLISSGLAGSLSAKFLVGDILEPELIFYSTTGASFRAASGEGTLVTANQVLGREEKRRLAEKYTADAVDMEAAAVAEVAAQAGVPFFAVKAISDSLEFSMPDLTSFIDGSGKFATGRFLLHTALRPSSWATIAQLARNSSLATRNLCARLQHLIDNEELTANAINLKHS